MLNEVYSASIAYQTGIASSIQDRTMHLNGFDLRHEGGSHSLWLLSNGIEEAPGHWRGALQQQICQHHPRRQVVAADACVTCREGQLLKPFLSCLRQLPITGCPASCSSR